MGFVFYALAKKQSAFPTIHMDENQQNPMPAAEPTTDAPAMPEMPAEEPTKEGDEAAA